LPQSFSSSSLVVTRIVYWSPPNILHSFPPRPPGTKIGRFRLCFFGGLFFCFLCSSHLSALSPCPSSFRFLPFPPLPSSNYSVSAFFVSFSLISFVYTLGELVGFQKDNCFSFFSLVSSFFCHSYPTTTTTLTTPQNAPPFLSLEFPFVFP